MNRSPSKPHSTDAQRWASVERDIEHGDGRPLRFTRSGLELRKHLLNSGSGTGDEDMIIATMESTVVGQTINFPGEEHTRLA